MPAPGPSGKRRREEKKKNNVLPLMSKALFALSLGTFALGVAEFAMMSILSSVAADLDVSIPDAGHFISAYALGVCAGVVIMVAAARTSPLKRLLTVIVSLILAGNALTVFAAGYATMLASRFIAGLPHGAFFGVGSIIATQLAAPGRASRDVCLMVAGMTIANLAGVPLASFLSWSMSWRCAFGIVALVAAAVLVCVRLWVPALPALPDKGFRAQFRFLGHLRPWLVLAAIGLGNGGFFAYYSYVNPVIEEVAGLSPAAMSAVVTLAGFGMVAGNLFAARLSHKVSDPALASIGQGVLALSLLVLFLFAPHPVVAILFTTLAAACVFFISGPEQVMMLRDAKEGQLLAAALGQCAFNAGNAGGAWLGGLPIDAGRTAEWASLPGTILAAVGFFCLFAVWLIHNARMRERAAYRAENKAAHSHSD